MSAHLLNVQVLGVVDIHLRCVATLRFLGLCVCLLQIGSLPNKVRRLERNYQKLKQELENSPWSRFQRVMMDHLKENGDLGNSLSQEELEKLEEMHNMAEPDRKV